MFEKENVELNLGKNSKKKIMKKRFFFNNHKQDTFLKLNFLRQHGLSIEEYIREFEQLFIKCDVLKIIEHNITYFLDGIRRKIIDLVELQPYWSLNDI